MYAIAYKERAKSSWQMFTRVFDDREKVDAVIAAYIAQERYYRVQRVFWEPDI